jgi:hypothetical protein
MDPVAPVREQLGRQLDAGRIHSAYLLSGPGSAPRETATWLVRALACEARTAEGACESCLSCRRSQPGETEIELDGTGKSGPLLRHVGDHPDLFWIERGGRDTRVRIGQVRALQSALRLRSSEGRARAAVVADAEWLNLEAQNALLRLLEEPPPQTTLILVSASAAGLLATVRSRCQRYPFPRPQVPDLRAPDAPEALRELVCRLDDIARQGMPELLDWAEEFRGPRAEAAEAVTLLLQSAAAWLHADVRGRALAGATGDRALDARLDAFGTLQSCRKALVQRNANPQMVAERALFALREASAIG